VGSAFYELNVEPYVGRDMFQVVTREHRNI